MYFGGQTQGPTVAMAPSAHHVSSAAVSAAAPAPPKAVQQSGHISTEMILVPETIHNRQIIDKQTGATKTIRSYQRGRQIGKGAFAKCFDVRDLTTKQIYAAKVIPKFNLQKESQQRKLCSEIKIHRHVHHPHIVKFVDAFEDDANVYIILELCTNRSMMELMKKARKFSEPEARTYFLQIVTAVQYLHSHGIIHRDLKLGNLFLAADNEIKIGDFGLATKISDGERKKTMCGTPNYMAPEIVERGTGHSFEVDVWALGVILYIFLIGRPPFETTNVNAVYERIKAINYTFPDDAKISDSARNLIQSMLSRNPLERPKMSTLTSHPWFTCDPKAIELEHRIHEREKEMRHSHHSASSSSASSSTPSASLLTNSASSSKRQPLAEQPITNSNFNNNNNTNIPSSLTNVKSTEASSAPKLNSPRKYVLPGKSTSASSSNLIKATSDKQQIVPNNKENEIFHLNKISTASSAAVAFPSSTLTSKSSSANSAPKFGITSSVQVPIASFSSLSISAPTPQQQLPLPKKYITRWIGDQLNSIGIAYLLNDYSCGVLFADHTKMITHKRSPYISYLDASNQNVNLITFLEHPAELSQKIHYLAHYRSQFYGQELGHNGLPRFSDEDDHFPEADCDVLFVKKWLQSKHAMLFVLTAIVRQAEEEGVIQVDFSHDGTRTLLHHGGTLVTNMSQQATNSKKSQISSNSQTYPYDEIPSGNEELQEKLDYINKMLMKLIPN